MTRAELFEIIFDINPDFVIAECDDMFFTESLEPEDIDAMTNRIIKFCNERSKE